MSKQRANKEGSIRQRGERRAWNPAIGGRPVARKRGNSEGTICKRADGRYVAAVSLLNGKRKYLYGKTREEVAGKLATVLKAARDGVPIPSDRPTVGAFLSSWYEGMKGTVRPRTAQRYEELMRLHAVPALGRLRLTRLGPEHLQQLYSKLLGRGLAPATVGRLHTLLGSALKQAQKWGMVSRNVATLVRPPRVPKREMKVFDKAQAKTLLAAASGDRLEALYVLAVTSGMREGELFALRRQDLGLESGKLTVNHTLVRLKGGKWKLAEPKSARSRRTIVLSGLALAALKANKIRQAEERLALGGAWQDHGFVFTTEIGTPLDPGNLVKRSFYPLLERAGLPRVRFHDLRHTAATLMLAEGVSARIVADMLGHASVAFTLDTYGHVLSDMKEQAARAMDSLLGSG